jgi:glycosyltransferase involved in cell wall biosynthesis
MRSLFITETARREQSRHRLFNHVNKLFGQQGIDFNILAFRESQDEPILSVSGLDVPVQGIAMKLYKRSRKLHLWNCINNYKPDHILIGGYGFVENWIALIYAKYHKLPVTLWTGAGQITTESNSYIKFLLKRLFVKNIDSAVTYGKNAEEYLIKLGMNPNQIHRGVNVSDVAFFKKVLNDYYNSDEMLSNVKKLQRPVLVFAGRFERLKGLELLIDQLVELPFDQYTCYFIGTGTLLSKVQQHIKDGKINGKVFGFLVQADVAKRLVESDIYILPSLNDPFSRTLSEALAAGCFVLNSKYDDASYDLINEGENGFIFDPRDSKQFSKYLKMLTSSEWVRPNRAEVSQSLKYDMLNYAEKIVDSVIQSVKK